MTDKNREFAELCGSIQYPSLTGGVMWQCPDYAADPRLVLREMDRISKLHAFLVWLLSADTEGVPLVANCLIKYRYILDTTGLLRDKAISWMKGRGR